MKALWWKKMPIQRFLSNSVKTCMLGKSLTDDIYSRKWVFTFHAICLQWRLAFLIMYFPLTFSRAMTNIYNWNCTCLSMEIIALRGLETLGRLSAILTRTRKTTFVISCFLSCTPSLFRQSVYSKRKEFAPKGSKFFPFRVDPFQNEDKNIFIRIVSSESTSISPYRLR